MTLLSMLGVVAIKVAIRAAGVGVVATVLTRLMRGASAAARHLVWSTALSAVVLLPAAVVWAPQLPLTVLPQAATTTPPMAANGFSSAPPERAIASARLDVLPAAPVATQPVAWTWTALLAAIWLAGVVVFLARGVAGRAGIGRLVSRSRRAEDARLTSHAARIAARLRIRRAVAMYLAEHDAMALTWGVVSPKVLLPACATSWSDDRLDAVLVHELAHVARWDVLVHSITNVATAVQWFNPLVWMAARQAHRECERACDDVVIRQGLRASHYANDLLALVQTLTPVARSASSALAMARPSHLEERVLAILNPGANRQDRTSGSLIAACGIIAVALPLATARVTARPLVLPMVAEVRPSDAPIPGTPPTVATPSVPVVPSPHAIVPRAEQTRPAPADVSGRWTPIDSVRADALFHVGRSSLPVVPMTITQDATTLTIVRAMPSLLRQPARDWVVKVQLDGSETENEGPYALGGRVMKNRLRRDGNALVIATTDPLHGLAFEDVYTVDRDRLQVAESDGDGVVVTFVRAPAAGASGQAPVNFAGVGLVASPTVGAQSAPKAEDIVLSLQIQKNGTVIAKPVISMKVGGEAKIPIGDAASCAITPSRTDPTTLEVTLAYTDKDSAPTLRMELVGHEKTSATVQLGANTLVFDVTALDPRAN